MTEDYKERIIKYLTNNYTKEEESTTPFFATNVEVKELATPLGQIGRYIQGKNGKGNDLDIGFFYGTTSAGGFISIVDNNFNVLQYITQYNTGTNFKKFISLNIDNNNGNIYGIDYDETTQVYRFLLLNNFLIKTPAQQNYEVKLRNSYILNLNQHSIQFIDKNPNSAFYVIIGDDLAGRPLISTYKIEVGTQNELIDYTYQGDPTSNFKGYNIEWTGDDYKIVCACEIRNAYYNSIIKEFYLDNNSEYITDYFSKTLLDTYTNPYGGTSAVGSIIVTNDYTYVSYRSTGHALNNAIRILKFDDTNEEEVYYETVEFDNSYNGYLYKKNYQIYAYIFIAINMPAQSANTLYKVELGLIDNNDNFLYQTNTNLEIYDIINSSQLFDVKVNNNLITYSIVTPNLVRYLQAKQIYNQNNWNYTDYQDYNSMIPKSGLLYDEDGNIIFAKNLYNKTINGNTTISTLEIPNMALNDTIISEQDLLGETNGTLIINEEDIQKNIYEDVFINFINTLTMQNQNTQQYVYNLIGATRLNASISNTADYTNATLNRIRINYADNTSYVKSISPASQVSQFVYKYEFNIYVTKLINTIELISNDTNTTYQTIDGSQFEINKAYKISQNVEIQ